MNHQTTPDEVVAENIKRLRGNTISRKRLADDLAKMTGRPWAESTIKDLEGARSSDRGPRSARWTELIDLAIYFEATIFDLVLPQDPDTPVTLTRSSVTEDSGPLPDGRRKTRTVGYESRPTLETLGVMLFRMPGDWLTEDNLVKLVDSHDIDLAFVLSDAKTTAEGLQRMLETLEDMRLQQESKDGINS